MGGVGSGGIFTAPVRATDGSLLYFDPTQGPKSSGANLTFDGTTLTAAALSTILATITGGSIDNATIGATTRSTIRGTTGNFNALLTATAGIAFNNETLDTYREGTWTPTFAGDGTAGSNTYSQQVGYFIRIGRFAFCQCYMTLSAKDAAMAGNITVAGLPFTSRNIGGLFGNANIGLCENIGFGGFLSLNMSPNTTFAYLVKNNTAGATGLCQPSDMAATSQLRASIIYQV